MVQRSSLDPVTIAGRIVVGLIVGALVVTGVGGGMVLLHLLITGLDVPPIRAVGSDAVISCVTKISAGGLHWRRGNVSWRLVLSLSYGSIPGAALGIIALARMRMAYDSVVNDFIRNLIGVLLIVIPAGRLLSQRMKTHTSSSSALSKGKYGFRAPLVGFVAGLLVGLTSIGSGSVILTLLLFFYDVSPVLLVGTDIVHANIVGGYYGGVSSAQFRQCR
jgi:uncharacterized membrane protein YfcA